MGLILRDSQNNEPLPGAIAEVTTNGNSENFTANDEGKVEIPILVLTIYRIHVIAEGHINYWFEQSITSFQSFTKLLSASPTLEEGYTRIMLTWGADLEDVDIQVMAIPKDGSDMCKTYWDNLNGCDSISLDLDNRGTGLDGSE